MFIRYIMLLILGLTIAGECLWCIKRKVGGRKIFVIAILAYIIGFITIVQMLYLPLFQDEFTIAVIDAKNEKAINNEVYLEKLIIDTKEIDDAQIVQGIWIDDGEFQIYSPAYEDITQEITIKFPVGKERKIIFSKAPYCGMVLVDDGKEFSVLHDLYSPEIIDFSVTLPGSELGIRVADRSLKIGIFILLLLLEQIIIAKSVNLGWNKAVKILSDRKVGYVLFLMFGFFVFYLRYVGTPEEVIDGGYQNVFYFENYELGYLSRGFIGEVLSSIVPYWTKEALFIFKSGIAVIFFLMVSVCTAEIISGWNDKWMAMLMMGILLGYPWARLIFRDDMRSDICIYLFYIISVCLIYRAKESMIFVPLLCSLIVLTNETSCLTVIPSIAMLVVYRLGKTKEKKYVGILGGVVFSTIMLTGINLIYGKGGNSELLDSFENMQLHFEGVLNSAALLPEYTEFINHIKFFYSDFWGNWITRFVFGLICIPIFYLLGIFIKNIYLKYIEKYEKKVQIIFILMMVCSFSPVSAMLIAIDHPRYVCLIFIIMMSNILFLMKEGNVQISMNEMCMFQKEKNGTNLLPMGIVFFYFFIEKFVATCDTCLPQINKWVQYFGG